MHLFCHPSTEVDRAGVAKAVDDQMPAATPEAKAAEAKSRCDALAKAGLLIEQWNLDDIGADLTWCGKSGSPTKVHRIQAIVLKKEGFTAIPPTDEGVRGMIHELVVDRTLG